MTNARYLVSRNQRDGKRIKVKKVRIVELDGMSLIEFYYVFERRKDQS